MIDFIPSISIIQLITAFTAIGTCILLWKYKQAIEVRFLILLEIFVAIWAFSYALEFGTPLLEEKVFYSQLSYLGIAFIPVSFFFFTTAFSQKFNLVNRRNIILTLIIPLITLILVFTNDQHHLIWKNYTLNSSTNILHYQHGIWFWIFDIYTFTLVAWGIFNLISSISTFTSFYKKQIRLLIIASLIPVIANLMYIFDINPVPGFDWTTVSFVLTGLIIAFGIFRYKIFELIPLAREKLLDTMNEGVLVINANGIIEEVNPALLKTFDLDKKTIIYTSFKTTFERFPEIVNLIQATEDQYTDFELPKNDQTYYYQVRVKALRDQLGKLSGKLLVISDVTSIRLTKIQLKEKNKQLQEQNGRNEKLIDDLDAYAHTLAHDLKNPLSVIYSSSDIILEALKDGNLDIIEEFSKVIKESSMKTISVTNELLKMATAGHEDVETEPVEMDKVYQSAVDQISDSIERYNAILEVEGKWIDAQAYAPWIEEVWINLLSNAMKYGGETPVIKIGCETTGRGKIKYWVKDNGDGIPKDQQQKLFKKHTRLQPNKASGYGLGLSIVKRIIEKLGGKVGVESTGEKGDGALFYFNLPVVKVESLKEVR
ncbi:histidine kinase N-terminal 7TM domain-containing protein [Draconibacterium sp. IB214405]|uniref:histidine kinase N-terminal 7TM domain-containing protein n=1 Tax=Draconibacterium sp. IB214405 TaxID=3097352 RepID=UPI002A14E35C|nr:histidine kinase N-terminal 7TM domain-containing protein [Draconibacterium sp. IB214405]MDX8339879.1 histidine kinase N-terminal 7TM domain-containing protein [Draconibacterium sp. IB214405]